MLRKRIHNIIDFYPLPLSVTLLRASGIWRAGRKGCCMYCIRPCPYAPNVIASQHRHVWFMPEAFVCS